MDDDADMDAPQISTLREETTPPPPRGPKLRAVKLLLNDKKGAGKHSPPSVPAVGRKNVSQNQPLRLQSDEEVDEEEEEDQLIDDDEPAPSISVSAGTKRKAPPKKPSRSRKTDKQDKEEKKPDEPREPPDNGGQSVNAPHVPEKPPPKKKAAPRKTAVSSKPKIKVPTKGAKALAIPPPEDVAMSETAHTITAPSSPFPVSRGPSPEPEEIEPPPPPPAEQPGESLPLPLPVYPLPSKPFPVQPPPKIGTGFATMQPLDRSGAKVRPWRVANREIRGIAGGRWFARSWVGDKESDYATAATLASSTTNAKVADSDKVAIPKAVTSISASGKSGKSKGARGSAATSAAISTAPSRSGSIVQEHHTVKAPTKMRNIITGPASEAGDDPEVAVREPPSISAVS